MRVTLFLLFGLLICQVSSGRHGKHDRIRRRGNRGNDSSNYMNGCKSSDDCIANQGYCIAEDKVEDCEGMLFPKECTSVHCSCCVPVTLLVDECATGENDCPADTTCQDKDLGFDCLCEAGLQKCGDVDECTDTPDICGANSICTNTFGSYDCSCILGYQRIGDTCEDIDECADIDTCPPNSMCVNSPGSFDCVCDAGFEEANGLCQDIDECLGDPSCPELNRCVNTPGSYECICVEGYEIASDGCTDIDECNVELNPCGNGTCDNTEGGYVCTCAAGFIDNGGICEDENECLPIPCLYLGENSVCTNTPGSFFCSCEVGFREEDGTCIAIDECASSPCDISEDCINTLESHECVCKSVECPSKCFLQSLYVEGAGCVLRMIGGWTFREAERRCLEEHEALVMVDSLQVAEQLLLAFQTTVTGYAWIGGADSSIATPDNPSECLAIDMNDAEASYLSLPCDIKLENTLCGTFSVY